MSKTDPNGLLTEGARDQIYQHFEFMHYLFDDENQALKAAEIIQALLEAQSPGGSLAPSGLDLDAT